MKDLESTVIHVGMNKTATTWLQHRVFPLVTSHRLIGRFPGTDGRVLRKIKEMQTADQFERGSLLAVARSLDPAATRLLLTEEGLASTLRFESDEDFVRNVERLAADFASPSTKILLVIRRQEELLLSSYGQYVRMGGSGTLEQFLSGKRLVGYQHRYDRYDLYQRVSTFQEHFGGAVVVKPYEILRRDQYAFVVEVFAELGLSAEGLEELQITGAKRTHKSSSSMSRRVTRRFNAVSEALLRTQDWPRYRRARRLFTRADELLGLSRRWPDDKLSRRDAELVAQTAGAYAVTNRKLAEITGIDLVGLGYST